MIRYSMTALAAAATLSTGTQVLAQTPEAAPRPMHPSVGVMGYAPSLRAREPSPTNREEPGLLRRARPDGDIRDWIAEDDPLVALLRHAGPVNTQLSLQFDIGPDGRATGCRTDHRNGAVYAEGLCERVGPRVRMIPALDTSGVRAPDKYELVVHLQQRTGPPPERLVDFFALPPGRVHAPWIIGPEASATTRSAFLAAMPAGSESVVGQMAFRLDIDVNGAVVGCVIHTSSADDGLDLAACEQLRRIGRFSPARDGAGKPMAGSLFWRPTDKPGK